MKLKAPLVVKTCVGLVVGAGLGTAISFMVIALFQSVTGGNFDPDIFRSIVAMTFFVLLFMVPTGLIAHAVLYGLKLRNWYYYCGLAGLAGGATGQFLLYQNATSGDLTALVTYGGWAALCALITWLIRRPDKDVPPPQESHF